VTFLDECVLDTPLLRAFITAVRLSISGTPVHDHLAWGPVGLYHGRQDEEIYARRDGRLEVLERRALTRGDFYALIPPRDDIHRVRTTSPDTSVSIHLLTNDTGCIGHSRGCENLALARRSGANAFRGLSSSGDRI